MAEGKIGSTAKQVTLFLLAVVIIIMAVVYFAGRSGMQRTKIIREGDQAPEFSLPATDGREITLSGLHGKVVMVHFWATWCPPCVEEMPTIEGVYRTFTGKDFELLAVSVDEGGLATVNAFLAKNNLKLPVLLNPDASVARGYGTFKFPETFLVDRQGIVRLKAIGARDWMAEPNQRIIRQLIEAPGRS